MTACFNCGAVGPVHHHHVVPRSLGGVATVPLCGSCHGKAHGHEGLRSTSELTKAAMRAKAARGEAVGHPRLGYRVVDGRPVADPAEASAVARAVALRASGLTLRALADALSAEGYRTRAGLPHNLRSVSMLLARAPALDTSPR